MKKNLLYITLSIFSLNAMAQNVGVGTSSPVSKLNVNGGLAIGDGNGVSTVHGARRSLQINTDLLYGGTYDNHSGALLYSTMPGGWTTARLNFAISNNWASYNESTNAFSIGQALSYFNSYLSIGTNGQLQPLSVVNNTEWNVLSRSTNTIATHRNHLLLQRANGINAVTADFTLGGIAMGGFDGTNYSYGWNGGAEITAFANQTWTSGARGAYLSLRTTADNEIAPAERVRIADNGNVGINTTPSYKLDVNGSFRTVSGNLSILNDYFYVSPINSNTLNSGYHANDDASDFWINYRGYQDGFTRFRNFNVGNGKGGNIAWFDAANGRMSINNGQAAASTLDVNGDARATIYYDKDNSSYYVNPDGWSKTRNIEIQQDDANGHLLFHDPSNVCYSLGLDYADGRKFKINHGCGLGDNNTFTLTSGGRIGIGTNDPQARLHVSGGAVNAGGSGRRFAHNIDLTTTNGAPTTVAYFDGDVLASLGFYALQSPTFSDSRIKDIVGISSSAKDLQTLNQIQITDYKLIDSLATDNRIHKKVIAQQIETIASNLVYKKQNYIPNVYCKTNQITVNQTDAILSLPVPHKLAVNEKIKLSDSSGNEYHVEIKEIKDVYSFSINKEDWIKGADQLFVYGKEVNDFRAVDYEGITTLNVSATQELSKLLTKALEEIAQLKKENEALHTIKAELSELKSYIYSEAKK